jgi:molybdopterin-binding protein
MWHARIDDERRKTMKLSTRNQLAGRVTEVKLGGIMAEVVVDLGGQSIVAAITRGSAEELELAAGDEVTVLVKATEVMLGK